MDFEEEKSAPNNIIPAVFRYKWHLAVSIPVLLLITSMVVLSLPSIYQSKSRITVETQQIPKDFVQSTVTAAASEQIQVIEARVMTRENLRSIVEKYDAFGAKGVSPAQLNGIIYNFKKQMHVGIENVRRGRGSVAIGFTVAFESESPALAQAVTSDLVTLFLKENVEVRTKRATETTDFLREEAKKVREELDTIEQMVAEFKNKNKDALPEHLDLYTDIANSSRQLISDIDRSISSNRERIKLLENQIVMAREQNVVIDSERTENLDQMRTRYKNLLLVYQPSHPDVIALKEQIELLENNSAGNTDDEVISNAELSLKNQISVLTNDIELLEKNRDEQEEKLESAESKIIRIPQVEQGFKSINRDYYAKQEQYNSMIMKLQEAEVAESLEVGAKAERFIILEPPYLPSSPSKPNRLLFLLVAFGFSFGFPAGIVLAIGFLDKSIRNSSALEIAVGAPPLMEIPIIKTEEELTQERKIIIIGLISAVSIVLFALLLIQIFYLPLDEFFSKIVSRVIG